MCPTWVFLDNADNRSTLEDSRCKSLSLLARWVINPPHTVLDDRSLLGVAVTLIPWSLDCGIGTELCRVATQEMKQQDMKLARVGTAGDPSHAPARRAYEKGRGCRTSARPLLQEPPRLSHSPPSHGSTLSSRRRERKRQGCRETRTSRRIESPSCVRPSARDSEDNPVLP